MYDGKAYKPALDACLRAIDLKPKYMDVLYLRGEIRFAMKEYAYCIKELSEAIKLAPAENPNYNAYKTRAKARFELRDYKNAISDWNVYLEAFPDEEGALISRGACKIETRDNTGAIVDFDTAIKLNAKNPVSYNYRGVAKGESRQFVEALKDFDYAIKLKYDYAGAFVNRAAVKFASKDKHGACDDLNKADSLGDEMAIQLIETYCKHQ
jgi:tetratricopeptide (TPR) repeat protein